MKTLPKPPVRINDPELRLKRWEHLDALSDTETRTTHGFFGGVPLGSGMCGYRAYI